MIAMFFLDAAEQRELTVWAEVKLEASNARGVAIVDALGIFAVGPVRLVLLVRGMPASRLPVALEYGAAAIVDRRELGLCRAGATQTYRPCHAQHEPPAVLAATPFISPA